VFCREPIPGEGQDGNDEKLALVQKRVDAGDALAHFVLGQLYFKGEKRLAKHLKRAIELWKEAANLGSVDAHFSLAVAYHDGNGIKRDTNKAVHHYQVAAVRGHFMARHDLGCIDYEEGRMDRSLQHLMISAKMGWDNSLKAIQEMYVGGHATKDDYAQALLGYQNATEEMKSVQRDKAELEDISRYGTILVELNMRREERIEQWSI